MVRSPKPGMRVQFWYRKSTAWMMPYHAGLGTVVAYSTGKGPRNVGVRTDGDVLVVVPRGNIRPPRSPEPQMELF